MFKFKYCGNLAQKCLIWPTFLSRTTLAINQQQVKSITDRVISEKSPENLTDHREKLHSRWKPVHSEKEFLVRAKADPDTFGQYNEAKEDDFLDEGDIKEEKYFTEQPARGKKLRTKQYADIIKDYIRQRKIKEAIDVVEIKMIQEDRVKPENYIYNLLLGACGRVGYTKKAFMLYNDMKKRGLEVTGGTYTALFNACANSPWPTTDGLTRAHHLYDIMIEKGDQPNHTNYNAMIKAFGRCGDLPKAFSLVDEMALNGFPVSEDTINFLLQACITDKESGFRHALLVWRKLMEKNIRPNVYTFNLLLRSVRDCGLGDLEATQDVISKLVGGDIECLPEAKLLQLEGSQEPEGVDYNGDESNKLKPIKEHLDLRPNLLSEKPHLGNILSLSEVKEPEDRLLLLGSCKGFLETMVKHKCTPDIKTFTQLLNCIPSTNAAEKELIVAMRKLNIEPDIDFYNMLIKKKSLRLDYEGAKEVVRSMKHKKMRPDLITYGILAMGCQTKAEANDLVNEMTAAGYRLNAAILGAMLQQGCYHIRFDYVFEIMEICLRESVPVNKKFLEHLDGFKQKVAAKLHAKELNKSSARMFGIFKERYNTWKSEVQIDESEEAHLWQQYRQSYPGNVKYAGKDTARFKPRRKSLFKVKTSTKVRY